MTSNRVPPGVTVVTGPSGFTRRRPRNERSMTLANRCAIAPVLDDPQFVFPDSVLLARVCGYVARSIVLPLKASSHPPTILGAKWLDPEVGVLPCDYLKAIFGARPTALVPTCEYTGCAVA